MTDQLLARLCALGIGIARDAPSSEVLVRWELVWDAIRRIGQQAAEIRLLRALLANVAREADDDVQRYRAMVEWFVSNRIADFHETDKGAFLAYDGVIWDHTPLPDDIADAFRRTIYGGSR